MCVCFQNAEVSVDVWYPIPIFLPVRTKKRYFVPPAVGVKRKAEKTPEDKARAAGIVFRQEYMERPINIACTGKFFLVNQNVLKAKKTGSPH